jgi:hypothetical protein
MSGIFCVRTGREKYVRMLQIIIIILLQLGVHPVAIDLTLIETRKDYT